MRSGLGDGLDGRFADCPTGSQQTHAKRGPLIEVCTHHHDSVRSILLRAFALVLGTDDANSKPITLPGPLAIPRNNRSSPIAAASVPPPSPGTPRPDPDDKPRLSRPAATQTTSPRGCVFSRRTIPGLSVSIPAAPFHQAKTQLRSAMGQLAQCAVRSRVQTMSLADAI